MSETPSTPNGAVRWRPVLPTAVVVTAIVVAVGAVSGLIFLLYQETRGPGEILRQFAQAVDEGDCPGSYDLLDESVQAGITEEEWCRRLPQVDRQLDADFALERAVLLGDEAIVRVSEGDVDKWTLRRFGERSWRVVGPEEVPLAGSGA
jgi:hypothetical protein